MDPTTLGIFLGAQAFALLCQIVLIYKFSKLIEDLRVNYIPIPFAVAARSDETLEIPVDEEPTDPGSNAVAH